MNPFDITIHNSVQPQGVLIERNDTHHPHGLHRKQGLPLWLLELTLDGAAVVSHGHNRVDSTAGHAFLYPPHAEQAYGMPSGGNWTHFWAVFSPRPHWSGWLAWPGLDEGLGQIILGEADLAVAAQLATHIQQAFLSGGMARWNHVMLELERLVLFFAEHTVMGSSRATDPRIEAVCQWMHGHLDGMPTVDELAEQVGLSGSRFAHLFKAEMKASPLNYFEDIKIQWACLRLRMSDERVSAIASSLGYSSVHYFSRAFKKRMGRSPRHYREAQLKVHYIP